MPGETDKKIKMMYDAKLSIKDNAANCDVSVSTMRTWIKQNKIDRNFDAKLVRFKAIKKLQKRIPPLTAQQIANKTGYSVNTCKKYMRIDSLEQESNQEKLSTFDVSKNETIIKSVSNDQHEILNWILKLYVPSGFFQADFTFSKGVFYKDNKVPVPQLRFDKFPEQCEGVLPLEDAERIIDDGTLDSCIVDLPFLVTHKEWTETSRMAQRFNSFDNMDEATEANKYIIRLAYRKLKKKGIYVMKTQDLFTEGKQLWFHRYVQEWAEEIGFKLMDMFLLSAETRMLGHGFSQRVARKYHSYFFVFQKKV